MIITRGLQKRIGDRGWKWYKCCFKDSVILDSIFDDLLYIIIFCSIVEISEKGGL